MKKIKHPINSNKGLKYKDMQINDCEFGITKKLLDKYKTSDLVFTINGRITKEETGEVALES